MKYVPGLMVGQLSGKAGSTVASRNKGGSYFRTRVIPKHVVNAFTSEVRADFASAAQAFRALEESQREAWNSLGAQITKKTSLGETIHLTGLQALVLINRNLNVGGNSPNYIAPDFTSPAPLTAVTATVAANGDGTTTVVAGANSATQHLASTADMFEGAVLEFQTAGQFRTVITVVDPTHVILDSPVDSTTAENVRFTKLPTISLAFQPTPVPTGNRLVIEATSPLSAGVSRPSRGQFRAFDNWGATTASPVDEALLYVQRFGLPPAGSKIFFRVKIQTSTGFAAPPIQAFAIVS